MITVYHLAVSQSDRIVWLLEELGVPYQLEWFDRGESGLAPKAYLDLHPTATAPVIRDGDVILSESAAIVEYLSQRHGAGSMSVAPNEANYPDYLYWMQFNNAVQSVFFVKLAAGDDADAKKPIVMASRRREEAYYRHLDHRLGESDFLAGDKLTCADILAVFNLTTLPLFGARPVDDLPNVQRYLERITKRPAYRKAMEKAGPEAVRP